MNYIGRFSINIFSHSVRKAPLFARSNKKKHALKQALYTLYEKIVFDTRVRKWLYPLVAFSPSFRSGTNVPTRIKSLFRSCIENNYFWVKVAHVQINLLSCTPCVNSYVAHAKQTKRWVSHTPLRKIEFETRARRGR